MASRESRPSWRNAPRRGGMDNRRGAFRARDHNPQISTSAAFPSLDRRHWLEQGRCSPVTILESSPPSRRIGPGESQNSTRVAMLGLVGTTKGPIPRVLSPPAPSAARPTGHPSECQTSRQLTSNLSVAVVELVSNQSRQPAALGSQPSSEAGGKHEAPSSQNHHTSTPIQISDKNEHVVE